MMRAKLSTCALLFAVSQSLFAASDLPAAGMSMKAVEAKYGQPQHKDSPVGRPPITRWQYADFVVVFEHSTVVDSMNVTGGSATPAKAPAPAATPARPAEPAKPTPAPSAAAPAPEAAAPTPAPAPAAMPTAPGTSPAAAPAAGDAHQAAEAAAMDKAAAEKSAASPAAPAAPAPAAAPAPDAGYTFDPETGRIIVK